MGFSEVLLWSYGPEHCKKVHHFSQPSWNHLEQLVPQSYRTAIRIMMLYQPGGGCCCGAPSSYWTLQSLLQENLLVNVEKVNIIHIDKYSMKDKIKNRYGEK